VRRNLATLDVLYVISHRSRDGTREILAALRAEGLALRVFVDEGEGFFQSQRINSLARRAFAEDQIDAVVPIDADEMLVVDDRAAFERSLAALPGNTGGVMQWLTYVPSAADDPAELCPVRRLVHRFDVGPRWATLVPERIDPMRCKVVVGRWFAGLESAWIFEGNHVVVVDGEPRAAPVAGIANAHFPVRTDEQLARKGVLGWLSFLASGQEPEKHGFALHWKRICERIGAGETLGPDDVREFVALYAPDAKARPLLRDPLPHGDYAIRYAHLRQPRPLVEAVVQLAEGMARRLGGAGA